MRPPSIRSFAALALVVATAVGVAGCGGGDPATKAAEARKIAVLDAKGIPGELNGLKVASEDVSKELKEADRPYLDALALYSLREGDELQATLQVGRFASDATYKRSAFRQSLLGTIGGGAAKKFHVGDSQVYLTTGDRQTIAVWFADRYIYILSSRDDYTRSRSLLRQALEVSP
jgi:hypothetical protein